MKTDIKVEEVDYKELGIYIAHNWSPGKIKLEGLNKACPSRRFNRGPRPTIHGKEAKGGKQSGGGAESKWEFQNHELNDWEMKKLIAASIEIGIIASFKNHIYCFGGKGYRQKKGGPIGSRLTMAVARVVMLIFWENIKGDFRRSSNQNTL